MSKISQDLARQLTKHLLDKKRQEVDKIMQLFQESVQEEYVKTIPEEVVKFNEKFPAYVTKTAGVRLDGNGFNNQYVSFPKRCISEYGNNGYIYFLPEKKTAVKLKELDNKAKASETKYKTVKDETYNAILSLGTAKKVAEAFPELANLVNQPVVGMIVNVADIKRKINALP